MSLSLSLWWPHNTSWLCNDIVFMWWKIASCFSKVFKACQPPEDPLYRKTKQCLPSPTLLALIYPQRKRFPSVATPGRSPWARHKTPSLFYSTNPPLIQFSFCSKREKKSKKMMKYKSRIQRTLRKKSRAILSLKVTFILPLSEKRMGTRNILTMS